MASFLGGCRIGSNIRILVCTPILHDQLRTIYDKCIPTIFAVGCFVYGTFHIYHIALLVH